MPFAANPSANILRLLFGPFRIRELPFLSVGPEPEIMSTTGNGLFPFGSIKVPYMDPVGVSSVDASSTKTAGACGFELPVVEGICEDVLTAAITVATAALIKMDLFIFQSGLLLVIIPLAVSLNHR